MPEAIGPIPEAWVGERVGIVTESSESFTGELLQVNDRGIVIDGEWTPENIEQEFVELREAAEKETLPVPTFFPWPNVKLLHRVL